MTLYSPFDAHPGQQWSNLIRPRPSTQTDTAGERVVASAFPATLSPTPVVIAVRCAVKPRNAVRLVLPVKPQAKAAPRQGNSAGNVRTLIGSRGSLPLFSRYVGTSAGRTKFVGAMKAPRASSLLKPRKQSCSGLAYRFRFLRWLVALVHDENSNRGDEECSSKEFQKTEKEFPRIA